MIRAVLKIIWRRLKLPVLSMLHLVWRYPAYLVSFLRSPNQAVYSWPERVPEPGPRIVLFIHFDRNGVVWPYVRAYLAMLRDAGLSVYFVSNSGKMQPESLTALKQLCDAILIRRNIGYDFAAMREGLHHFGLPGSNTDLLVLANDSVYGPLRPLNDILGRIDFEQADVWGATESWQSRYHLQSYFIAVGRTALQHPAWAEFWAQVRPVQEKTWVILRYEVGFTQRMIRAGLRGAAIWKYNDLVRDLDSTLLMRVDKDGAATADPLHRVRRGQAMRVRAAYVNNGALNPTTDLWRQLLRAGFPFIKRELLRDNPTFVADVVDWRMEALHSSGVDISLIESDLQRLSRNRVP